MDVIVFSQKVEKNLFNLICDLKSENYVHGQYIRFCVHDPKKREISKAPVRDRVLHHAICRMLVDIFDKTFIFDSYSSRKEKGTHLAIHRLQEFAKKLSRNHTKTVWALQLDVRKFFDSVDHEILLSLLKKKIKDKKVLKLLERIINSFEVSAGKGIPLGNLTSQLFSNVYLDLLDQFVKRKIGAKFYIRYADDIVMLSTDKIFLENCLLEIEKFILANLKIKLHTRKTTFKKWHSGIDFLGYVVFPHHAVLRTKTKKRMLRKIDEHKKELQMGIIDEKSFNQILQSYLGILKHCRGKEIERKVEDIVRM